MIQMPNLQDFIDEIPAIENREKRKKQKFLIETRYTKLETKYLALLREMLVDGTIQFSQHFRKRLKERCNMKLTDAAIKRMILGEDDSFELYDGPVDGTFRLINRANGMVLVIANPAHTDSTFEKVVVTVYMATEYCKSSKKTEVLDTSPDTLSYPPKVELKNGVLHTYFETVDNKRIYMDRIKQWQSLTDLPCLIASSKQPIKQSGDSLAIHYIKDYEHWKDWSGFNSLISDCEELSDFRGLSALAYLEIADWLESAILDEYPVYNEYYINNNLSLFRLVTGELIMVIFDKILPISYLSNIRLLRPMISYFPGDSIGKALMTVAKYQDKILTTLAEAPIEFRDEIKHAFLDNHFRIAMDNSFLELPYGAPLVLISEWIASEIDRMNREGDAIITACISATTSAYATDYKIHRHKTKTSIRMTDKDTKKSFSFSFTVIKADAVQVVFKIGAKICLKFKIDKSSYIDKLIDLVRIAPTTAKLVQI